MTNNYAKLPDGSFILFDDQDEASLSALLARVSGQAAWEVVLWRRPTGSGAWSRFRQVGEDGDLYLLLQVKALESVSSADAARVGRVLDGYRFHGLHAYGSLLKEMRERYRTALEGAGIMRPRAAA